MTVLHLEEPPFDAETCMGLYGTWIASSDGEVM